MVLMDKHSRSSKHPKTVPIRQRTGEGSTSSTGSTVSNIEGTFISLAACDSTWEGLDFINSKFLDDEEDDIIKVVEFQTEEKPPLFLLFPDLENDEKKRLAASTSTTQVTQVLVGKKADFSLLKPSKKLNPIQSRLPPLMETANEQHGTESTELGN